MNIQDTYFYKYICLAAMSGLISSVMAIILLRLDMLNDIMNVSVVFMTCWCVGGTVSWVLYFKLHNLAFFTYFFSIIFFTLIVIKFGDWNDTSVRGWNLLAIQCYIMICMPTYYVNKKYIIPRIIVPPSKKR